jgi:hypothetical protein
VSAIDEQVVREFFELNGFLVRQLSKHQVQSRRKQRDEAIDFVVFNPRPDGGGFSGDFILFPSTLRTVRRAIVSVLGWHSERISAARLRSSPEVFDFLAPEATEAALLEFPAEEGALFQDLTRILVVPGLPDPEDTRAETIRGLRERGVDAVLTFRSMLTDLISRVEVNHNYRKSDVLQLIRLLKNYNLVAPGPQLELNLKPGGMRR